MRITARLMLDVTFEVPKDANVRRAKADIEQTLLALGDNAQQHDLLTCDWAGTAATVVPTVTFHETDNYTGGFRVRCTIGEKEVLSLRYLREAYGKTYPTWEAASLEGNMLQDTAAHVGLTDHPCYNPVRI